MTGRRRRDARAASVESEYARLAPEYDARWAAYIERTIGLTLERLPAGTHRRVLDVGCGTGALLAPLAERLPAAALHGADPSPPMLALAAARLPARVTLVAARAEALPYRGGIFDLVASTSALHYAADLSAAAAEMHRVMRPGGRLLVTDWSADFLSMRLFDRVMRALGRANFTVLDGRAWETLLRGAGFEAIRIEPHRVDALWGVMVARAAKPAARAEPPSP